MPLGDPAVCCCRFAVKAAHRGSASPLKRRVGILLVLSGAATAGVSLLPDLAPWAVAAGCRECAFDAFSGWPGFLILPLALVLVGGSVVAWTAGDRVSSPWVMILAASLIAVIGAFAGLGGPWTFPDSVPKPPTSGGALLQVGGPYRPPSPYYGTWVATAGGVLGMAGGAFLARASRGIAALRLEAEGGDHRRGWSPLVMVGSFLTLAGGVIGVMHFAVDVGAAVSVTYSAYLALPLVIGLSRSPLVWRPAAALALVGAGAILVATVGLGYQFELLTAGALLAALGSVVSLLAPARRLRVTGTVFGRQVGLRILAGSAVLVAITAGATAVAFTMGPQF
jgi:hypothetical protein